MRTRAKLQHSSSMKNDISHLDRADPRACRQLLRGGLQDVGQGAQAGAQGQGVGAVHAAHSSERSSKSGSIVVFHTLLRGIPKEGVGQGSAVSKRQRLVGIRSPEEEDVQVEQCWLGCGGTWRKS